MMLRHVLPALLLAWAGVAAADATVPICHGYGCNAQARIRYSDRQLREVGQQLAVAGGPPAERKMLSAAVGPPRRAAGPPAGPRNDRGGNYADGHAPGKMDCIDHSTSTTRLLRLLETRGSLRWHRVLEPEARNWALVIPVHYSAVIEQKSAGEGARFAVDSWFVDNGQAAVILPLDEWKGGAGPDV